MAIGQQTPGIDAVTCWRIMSIALFVTATMGTHKSLYESLTNWLSFLGVGIRTALTPGLTAVNEKTIDECSFWYGSLDPDFDGWLHGDPMVTGNAASRYFDDSPEFVTGNDFGSFETGAADD